MRLFSCTLIKNRRPADYIWHAEYVLFFFGIQKHSELSPTESTVFIRDFNAHVGIDTDTCKSVIGKHVVTGLNENERSLLQLCCNNGLRIKNIFFQQKEVKKYTWYRPCKDQKSLIDFCIVSSDLFCDVLNVGVKC